MKRIEFMQFRAAFIPAACGAFVSISSLAALAQEPAAPSIGLPQDWSHRHLIHSNPDTQEETAAKGTLYEWRKNANDPRFVLQLEKKQEKAAMALEEAEESVHAGAARKFALGTNAATSRKKKKKPPIASGTELNRDWSNVMGGASGAGATRTYPAKFAFGISTKDCSNDFVVFTTSTAGATSTGTVNSRPGTFSAAPAAGGTVTITNLPYAPDQVLTLTAHASVNTGLNFAVGASATEAATNLANAIARNGGTVGATATAAGAVVTLTSITANVTNANFTSAATLTDFAWGTQTAGTAAAGQPTIFALNQLYRDTVANGGCQTATQAVPAVLWSYNTGTGAVADLSPALSIDGSQVAFIQRSAAIASLVLLKWSSSSPGTLGVPTTPSSATLANYRTCTAPCMTVMTLSGSPNNTNSAPFVDYANDIIYVGDDAGKLHKFTGVFVGTPAEVTTSPWPVSVGTTSILSSPVFDFGTGLVFVGSNGPNATGNRLHSVNASTGAVVSSGALGSVSTVNGVRDAPIVDSTAQRVYAFMGAASAATDSLGNTCSTPACAAVYQFVTTSSLATQDAGLGAGLGAKVFLGISDDKDDLNRSMNAGAFDDAYYSSAAPSSPSGSLYVCGHPATDIKHPGTLWKITISGNSLASRVQGPQLISGNNDDGCSPTTVFKNGSTERLYVSVRANAAALGGGACTQTTGCMYMYELPLAASFKTTSASSTLDGTTRFASVSTSAALNTTESAVETTLTADQVGTYAGMTITQSAISPAGTTFTYTLRKNGTNTAIACSIIAGQATCSDTAHTASFVVGDEIDVQVTRTLGSGTLTGTTITVQLDAGVTAALNATGGTGGIIIDNTVAGGGSQVYFATRTSPGIAVQASQAGLD